MDALCGRPWGELMEVEFVVELVRKHKTPFGRQTHEQVAISTSKCDYTLNRKDDWNSSKLPRLVVEIRGEVMVEEGGKGAKRGSRPKEPEMEVQGKRTRLQANNMPDTLPSVKEETPEPETEIKEGETSEETPKKKPKPEQTPKQTPEVQEEEETKKKETEANPIKWVKLGPGFFKKKKTAGVIKKNKPGVAKKGKSMIGKPRLVVLSTKAIAKEVKNKSSNYIWSEADSRGDSKGRRHNNEIESGTRESAGGGKRTSSDESSRPKLLKQDDDVEKASIDNYLLND